jgi:hypothetical protein
MSYWKGLGKFIWKILAGLLVILGIFQWAVKLKVSTWVIPNWIMLSLLVLTIAVVGYTAYFVGHKASPVPGPTTPLPTKAKIVLNEEEAFILAALSFNEERTAPRDALRKIFFEKLKGKNEADFNISLSKLARHTLITFSGNYITGQEYVTITGRGLEECEKLRDLSKRS